VTDAEIREAIDAGSLCSVREVTQATSAGGGCTSCHRLIRQFLAERAGRELRNDEAA
jgi:bacterioferritin-associated ferredoxin